MFSCVDDFLQKQEILILIALITIMVLVNSLGLSWGLPSIWHPDELVKEVDMVLDGEMVFNQVNFDYPSLPKHVMWLIGRLTDSLGYPRATFFLVSRFVSVLLGGLVAWLTYFMVRKLSGSRISSLLASLFIISNSEVSLNSHFAHNDMYVMFFITLTVFILLVYLSVQQKNWLYLAFFSAGLTASCKYNGGIIILAVILTYVLVAGKQLLERRLETFETFFVGTGLSILGFGLGTPTALLWFSFYIKRLLPALWRHANYNITPGSTIGFFSQWRVLQSTLSLPVFWLFFASFLAMLAVTILVLCGRIQRDRQRYRKILVLYAAIGILNIPTLLSYNIAPRFFLPLLPLLSVIAALALDKLYELLSQKKQGVYSVLVLCALLGMFIYGGMRIASVILSFVNDARIPASKFVSALPEGSSIEFTIYRPNVDDPARFSRAQSYPLIFLKFEGQEHPEDQFFSYNIGEVGVENRKPDYLVIDSFTYERFANDYVCQVHQAECDFFHRLTNGETNYRHLVTFSYSLPNYLPRPNLNFLNPTIQVYERLN